jgi:G3E family GTPase
MTLAILEHWFLVLPLPSAGLWRWSLKSRAARKTFDVEIVAGFLGAGKTTYIRRLLASADQSIRTIVLVNDFGALGIDGSLLAGRGAEIVELPNGCICCSLSQDLARQLRDAITRWSPQRVIIEPSGVADLAGLLAVLNRPDIGHTVGRLHVRTIIDAGSFLRDYGRMRAFIEAQVTLATMLIVNKIDLVDPDELPIIEATLQALNPTTEIRRARHGLAQAAGFEHDQTVEPRSNHHHGPAPIGPDGEHAGAFVSWSARLNGGCRPNMLRDLLDAVADGAYGQVERVKGIARTGAGWVHFDVSGGRSTVAAFAPNNGEEQRVTAIGRTLDCVRLQAAFAACAEQGGGSC